MNIGKITAGARIVAGLAEFGRGGIDTGRLGSIQVGPNRRPREPRPRRDSTHIRAQFRAQS